MISTYHTAEEITAILAANLPHGDPIRRAWEGVNADDQPGLVLAAAADLDNCAWAGVRASCDQDGAWPRGCCRGINACTGIDTEADLPEGIDAWSVAGLPGRFRVAHAIQAGWHASILLGADGGTQARLDDAARGIVAASGGGQSLSVDAGRADRPRLRLHPRARALVGRWLTHSAEVV
jgi:hypothetical protein